MLWPPSYALDGMRKVDIHKTRPGDILLTTQPATTSKVIRKATGSDISHAMLVVAIGSVIDSTGEGVQARNVDKLLYPDDCAIHALRPRTAPSADQLRTLIDYARSETGAPYTMLEAMRSVARPKGKGGANQFCSRLVARAYAQAGIALTSNPDFATPDDLLRSPLLVELSDVVIENAEQLEEEDSTKDMRQATEDLLQRLRALSPKIRTLSDVEPFLIANQQFDAAFAKAFQESGYLDVWKIETQRFPWRYDPAEMVQFYNQLPDKAPLLEYCRQTVADDVAGTFVHWERNLAACQQNFALAPLQTFALNRDLYLSLCLMSREKAKCADLLLRYHAQLPTP